MKRVSFARGGMILIGFSVCMWCGPLVAQTGPGSGMEEKGAAKSKQPDSKSGDVTGFQMAPDTKTHFELYTKSRRNNVKFTSKAPKETIEGKVSKFTGVLDFNPRKMDKFEGRFVVAWKDIDTGNKMRNEHMMGPPWVDTGKNPEINFTISGIEGLKAAATSAKSLKGSLVGKMAMNGKEKELKVPVTLTWIPNVGSKKAGMVTEGLGIKARFKVALADFGIEGRGVGEKVAKVQDIVVAAMLAASERALTSEELAQQHQNKPKKPPRIGA